MDNTNRLNPKKNLALYEKAKKLIEEDPSLSKSAACHKAGVSMGVYSYYQYKENHDQKYSGQRSSYTPRKRRLPEVIDIAAAPIHQDNKMVVIVTTSSGLKDVLRDIL